jgi:hypothetical protein
MNRLSRILIACLLASLCGCGSGASGTSNPTPTNPTPTPTATNHAPAISSMAVTTFAISDLGTFTGAASATDADGDTVTYTWDIGGVAASGTSWTKTLQGNGTYTATLTVSDGKGGSASDTRQFTVGNMTGTWTGILGPTALGSYQFTLTQTIGVVQGTYFDTTFGAGKIDPAEPGKIDAAGNVTMRVKQGPFSDWYFTGVMDSSGRKITGTVRGSGFTGQPFAIVK